MKKMPSTKSKEEYCEQIRSGNRLHRLTMMTNLRCTIAFFVLSGEALMWWRCYRERWFHISMRVIAMDCKLTIEELVDTLDELEIHGILSTDDHGRIMMNWSVTEKIMRSYDGELLPGAEEDWELDS